MFGGSDDGQMMVTIESHKTITLDAQIGDTFTMQTTPEKLNYSLNVDWNSGDGGEASGASGESAPIPTFNAYKKITLEFVFHADATGLVKFPEGHEDDFGSDDEPTIKAYLDKLYNVVYGYNPASHGPPYLKVIWGENLPDSTNSDEETATGVFACHLEECGVEITHFSLKGHPIKAKITLKLTSLVPPDGRPTGESPDLTHHIPIKHGDKMTRICNEIYGRFDAKICAAVSQYNGIISWRSMQKDSVMSFPSIHMLNELYLDEWTEMEKKAEEGPSQTHYEHMCELIGQQKADQYFRTFEFDKNEPYTEWLARREDNRGYA